MGTSGLPELKAGIYRHYKGPLYQVLGYGHDSNIEGRTVVVYIGLQLDLAKRGPRLAVREFKDFFEWVEPQDENLKRFGKVPRFEYLGPELI